MLPEPSSWNLFYKKFNAKTGLDLSQYKQDQLQRRILLMAETKKCKNLDEFWNHVGASEENLNWFQDKLAINVTELFRNPEKWEELRTQFLPELLAGNSNLKCWSAGCSIGAEAHTLAILFSEYFPGRHRIDCTDIDKAALAQAQTGRFNNMDVRGVPPKLLAKYFDKKSDSEYVAKPSLKPYLNFRQQNLLNDPFQKEYDLILCRNVVIYFNDTAKDALYRRFHESLKPGGLLFVGSTERIFNAQQIGFNSPVPFFYRKPISEGNTWRNAS